MTVRLSGADELPHTGTPLYVEVRGRGRRVYVGPVLLFHLPSPADVPLPAAVPASGHEGELFHAV